MAARAISASSGSSSTQRGLPSPTRSPASRSMSPRSFPPTSRMPWRTPVSSGRRVTVAAMRTLVALAALALILAAGAAAQPNPGVNGEIAFERSGLVLAFDPHDGTTHEIVSGQQPAWSPRGGLAFVRDGTIYVAAADGTNARTLVSGNWPAWSPDGSHLAFVRGQQLFMIDLDQSTETPLTGAGGEIVAPAWSPDGSEVAY